MKDVFKNYWALLIPAVILVIALFFFVKKPARADNTLIGMVDADYVDVAAEFPGRLDSLLVKQGDTVKKGQLLGVLRSTEINAIRNQALAAIDAAKGQLSLLEKGARPEAIKAADNLYNITQQQYALMQKTYQRMQNLFNDEVISGQEKDLVYFKLQAAKKEMETAKLNMDMLQQGSRPELITTASAIVRQAEHAYELTKALSDNTYIHAPDDGIISSMVIEQGEIVAIGYPLMTIQKPATYHITYNIRQDDIKNFPLGKQVKVDVPGCDPERFDATVHKVSPSLTFANWVPVKDQGKFELRTFTVELSPVNQASINGLRPGMTAAMTLP
ncbi:HlyD family secretion protein [Chitinophaga terrae (ex Kim and Jung 2007)]|uniref:HlyD family secretion protein n=1 Tax=Chitinophaga terrae (ex Kim and Jung 2007) TaxID=408074 RepID=UPI00277F3271|nr:HlyD family secretion protein [Chitinophaga terrae (ex Kim and Jung 2007)]MDQ0106423.1 HlyD family secretion protein [Chitinophaga terrae (ex Kim and Jung 2007)]